MLPVLKGHGMGALDRFVRQVVDRIVVRLLGRIDWKVLFGSCRWTAVLISTPPLAERATLPSLTACSHGRRCIEACQPVLDLLGGIAVVQHHIFPDPL